MELIWQYSRGTGVELVPERIGLQQLILDFIQPQHGLPYLLGCFQVEIGMSYGGCQAALFRLEGFDSAWHCLELTPLIIRKLLSRSEERRVGKECRSGGSP